MSREAVESLIDRWINDPVFREELRKDPEGAIRSTGVELDEEEWAALRRIDWGLTDEDLRLQVSKAPV